MLDDQISQSLIFYNQKPLQIAKKKNYLNAWKVARG